ncbi:MAG TPA: MarR family transcriptional regulator [Gemmatimonadaceae bacterium]|jgi:MarR family 2-MHQ and catechol resistance regulon transcriptional repressor|nr:MarR family transcriptional regulator [Gemmatimonadaceae bacterium]
MNSPKRSPSKDHHPVKGGAPVTSDLPTTTALKLWVVLARSHAAISEVLKADIERHDLTAAEFGVMEALYHKGPQLLGEIQKKILVSSGGMTFLVDRLAKRGLAERQECSSDRRARYAALTKKGEKLMASIFPAHAAVIHSAMKGLKPADQRALTALLKELGTEAARLAAETPACKAALAEQD